jgi:hypothetical protein
MLLLQHETGTTATHASIHKQKPPAAKLGAVPALRWHACRAQDSNACIQLNMSPAAQTGHLQLHWERCRC